MGAKPSEPSLPRSSGSATIERGSRIRECLILCRELYDCPEIKDFAPANPFGQVLRRGRDSHSAKSSNPADYAASSASGSTEVASTSPGNSIPPAPVVARVLWTTFHARPVRSISRMTQ